jgi:S-adenosylmethionine-dependent methyltransferase
MTTPVSAFDDHLDNWKRSQAEPWMRLRYEIAQVYLQRHMPPPPARILDIGGGNGGDSLVLARAGYQVTILDYSTAMLADAQSTAQELGLADRVTCIHGDIATLTTHIPPVSIDVALCHNILQYVDSPALYLTAIASCLVPDGILSIINPNPTSEALRLACQQYDLVKAAEAIEADQHYVPTFDVTVHRYSAEQMARWLGAANMQLIAQYGIRCVCDYLADNARKYEPAFYEELRTLELVMGMRESYRHIARFMHLIAQAPSREG